MTQEKGTKKSVDKEARFACLTSVLPTHNFVFQKTELDRVYVNSKA